MRWITLVALGLIITSTVCHAAESARKATITAMGGIPINISAWGLGQAEFDEAVDEITAKIEYLESIISTYRPDSSVSRINSGEILEETPAHLLHVAVESLSISELTDGAFDITIKPLVQLWRRCRDENRLPTEAEYQAALELVGYRHVTVDFFGPIRTDGPAGMVRCRGIRLGQPGMMLDFGGIAKGYFADIAVLLLRTAGVRRCLVDCGGDVMTWQKPDERGQGQKPFRVAVQDPLDRQKLLAVLNVSEGAVVTSGNYERFYEIGGKRYCHIFDPRTGRPIEGMLSVTLLAGSGIKADALATAVFVMGAVEGLAFVEAHEGLEAVIISADESGGTEVAVSSGLMELIEFAPHS